MFWAKDVSDVETVGAYHAKTHLPKLLERVRRGERVTITKHGRPVARLVPVAVDDEERARQAASRIRSRRRRLVGVPLAELVASIHEGHRH